MCGAARRYMCLPPILGPMNRVVADYDLVIQNGPFQVRPLTRKQILKRAQPKLCPVEPVTLV